MGDTVLDSWEEGEKNTFTVSDKNGRKVTVNTLDILATQHSETEKISIAVVNKEPDKEKKLEILKDSHNGAFAVIGICCYFTVSLGVWSEIRTEMLPVVAAGYVISRALSGIAVVTFPAARGSGLVKTFQDGAQKKAVRITMIVYLVLAAVYLYFCSPVGMVVLLIIAGVVFGYYYRMSRKQFGGVTGDLAGYFLQICELALLVGGLIVQGIK